MASVLYISYDGMAEPLGQSQVIAYLEQLSDEHAIHIVSFEKPADLDQPARIAAVRHRLDQAGIGWTPLRYHSRPSAPATVYDIVQGQARCAALCRRLRPDIIHVRSYIPALIALPLKRMFGAKLLFDIRGFWPDERVDGGLWPRDGKVYRTVKALEKHLFRAADHIVTLTHASVPIIEAMDFAGSAAPPVTVIPTCADLDRFRLPTGRKGSPFTFGYVGSFGTCYLLRETMHLFAAIVDQVPDARMIIANRNEHALIFREAQRAGIQREQIECLAVSHSQMPAFVQRMHAASALYIPHSSAAGRAPTKLAEYLGCGVPCVGNTGVGDMESLLEGRGIGVAMRAFDGSAMDDAADRILRIAKDPATATACRSAASEVFSLSGGVDRYRAIYGALSGDGVKAERTHHVQSGASPASEAVSAMTDSNIDQQTVASFGEEWAHFDQTELVGGEWDAIFEAYFGIFPFAQLPAGAQGFDMGCGSGRWARGVAPKVGQLNCIDPAESALAVARRNLADAANVTFHHAGVDSVPLAPESQDFGYSLGVLHHIPDTAAALRACTALLKPGAPFLLYLYYRFDNRPLWFRALWKASELVRGAVSALPGGAKMAVTNVLAALVYWPLARFAAMVERVGGNPASLPLSFYRYKSFYTMRTDSRDRFGTPLEQRFTRPEIEAMMATAGLEAIAFSDREPYWVAVGTKARAAS